MHGEPMLRAARLVIALTCVRLILPEAARAADATEIWPEMSLYYQLNPASRIYLDGSYSKGKESNVTSGDASAYLDLSIKRIKPIMRKGLHSEDWQQNRSFWARLGYTRVFEVEEGERIVAENRGVVSLYGKASLPTDVWVEARARTDLRWIDGVYSTRYRFRLEATHEITVREHKVDPYFNIEWFYDGRCAAWARTLYQGGVQVTVSQRFRYEAYLAHQVDHYPSDETLNALGLVAKWYY